jgi:hypothetical protein
MEEERRESGFMFFTSIYVTNQPMLTLDPPSPHPRIEHTTQALTPYNHTYPSVLPPTSSGGSTARAPHYQIDLANTSIVARVLSQASTNVVRGFQVCSACKNKLRTLEYIGSPWMDSGRCRFDSYSLRSSSFFASARDGVVLLRGTGMHALAERCSCIFTLVIVSFGLDLPMLLLFLLQRLTFRRLPMSRLLGKYNKIDTHRRSHDQHRRNGPSGEESAE